MKRLFLSILVLFLFCFFIGGIPSVFAQDDDSDEFMLEEITVTAAKRSENQQKVAITMETITAEQMKDTGMDNLDEILNNVSNVIINKQMDGLRVTIRGLADVANTQHGMSVSMPTVAVNLDGVYSNRKDTGSALFDMERVEVLSGPQSTLYASNSPGGIVNVVTANPKLDKYEASATLELGNYDLLHTEGSLNAPISEQMALRAAFTTNVRNGYLSNGGDNEDSKAGRLRVLYQPEEDLSFVLTGEISKTSTQRSGGVQGFNDGYYEDGTKVDDYWFSDDTLPDPTVDTNKKLTGRMDWETGFGSLSIVPAYSKRSGDQNERMEQPDGTVQFNQIDTSADEKSIEVRMTSSEDFIFKWIAGVNYYKASNMMNSLAFDESGEAIMEEITDDDGNYVKTIQSYRYQELDETAKAIFANITYPVTEIFRVTGGYRMSWDTIEMINNEVRRREGGAGGNSENFETPGDDYNDPDYKLGLEYDLGENSMLFADYSTSYRVQGMGAGASSGEDREPEKLKAYTLGSKNRFLNNKVQLNASAFYYDYTGFSASDMVMAYLGEYPGDETTWTSENTTPDSGSSAQGAGRMYGLDLQTNIIITSNDLLNLSVSYLDSEWTDLSFDYEYEYRVTAGFMQPYTGDDIVENASNPVSYNGKPMTMTPPWTISAGYSHQFNLPNGGSIKAQIDSRYKSDYRMSWKENQYPWNYQESCTITNLSAGYTSPDGNWTLTGYVKNIEDYAEKRAYFSPGGGTGVTTLGNPRTYGAVLSANF